VYSDDDGNLPFSNADQYYNFLKEGGLPEDGHLPVPLIPIVHECKNFRSVLFFNILGWHFQSALRPTFVDLIPRIKQARIDTYVDKNEFPEANSFWSANFPYQYKIPVGTFIEAMQSQHPADHEKRVHTVCYFFETSN
jgi:hypothetical protein